MICYTYSLKYSLEDRHYMQSSLVTINKLKDGLLKCPKIHNENWGHGPYVK